MTELYILDSGFNVLGLVDGFASLIWTRRYNDVGEFELHLPGSELFAMANTGKYIYRADTGEAALIERIVFERDSNGGCGVIISGRMPEALLALRVIHTAVDVSGNAETAIRTLVADNAIDGSAESGREISGLALGAVNGVGSDLELQFEGENLLEAIQTICREQELSTRIDMDFAESKLIFTVWQGKDRTTAQNANSWAIFSDDFENINASGYERDERDFKNYAYVTGEREDESTVMIEVDARDDADEERREIYVDASDVHQEVDDQLLSEEDFLELLNQKGLEALAEYPMIDAVNGDIGDGGALVYRRDFDLGDLCEFVDNEVGIMSVGRVTEVEEVIENGMTSIAAVLGDSGATLAQKIARKVKSV